jgi:sporulation protein YlmC with PRC-barrel domain
VDSSIGNARADGSLSYALKNGVSATSRDEYPVSLHVAGFGIGLAQCPDAMKHDTGNQHERITGCQKHERRETPQHGKRRAKPMISALALHELPVQNMEGRRLGKLKDLMIEAERGTIAYAVLLFEEDKCFALPFNLLKIDLEAMKVYVDIQYEVFLDGSGLPVSPDKHVK